MVISDDFAKWSVYAAALFGVPLLLAFIKVTAGAKSYSIVSRLALWVFSASILAAVALVFMNGDIAGTISLIGFGRPTRQSLILGAAAGAFCFMAAGAIIALRARHGGFSDKDSDSFDQIADQPFADRFFLVLTAAVTEEVLYRGVGIAVGALLFGNILIAAAVSLAAFVVTHLGSWSLRHLPLVTILGGVLTGLYLFNGDLASVIVAHFIADAGVLLAPLMRRKR